MLREYFLAGNARCFAWSGLFVFVGHQVFKAVLKYRLNTWYGHFYDTLQQSAGEFASGGLDDDDSDAWRAEQRAKIWAQLGNFAIIVAPGVLVHPLAGYIRNRWVLAWRLGLVHAYLTAWDTTITPIEGASQRIHEDTQRFASGVQGCVATLLDALFTLVIFCPLLASLDPSLMVMAVLAAVGGVGVSAFIGKNLVGIEVRNQQTEAELRRHLVLLEVEPARVVDTGGSVPDAFRSRVRALKNNYLQLYRNFAGLAVWLTTYDQAAVLLPYILVAPRLFAARPEEVMTLGALTQTANAFAKVFDSLSIVSDNWLQVRTDSPFKPTMPALCNPPPLCRSTNSEACSAACANSRPSSTRRRRGCKRWRLSRRHSIKTSPVILLLGAHRTATFPGTSPETN